jgi:hypothetical protein
MSILVIWATRRDDGFPTELSRSHEDAELVRKRIVLGVPNEDHLIIATVSS